MSVKLLSLLFCIGGMDILDTNEDYLTEEMDKQRRKLKDISSTLDQQHQLLRLIIQVCSFNFGIFFL